MSQKVNLMGKYNRCPSIKLQFSLFPLELKDRSWELLVLVKYTENLQHKIQRTLPMQTQIGTMTSDRAHHTVSQHLPLLHPHVWRRRIHHWPTWKCLGPPCQRHQARNISQASARLGQSNRLVHTSKRDRNDGSKHNLPKSYLSNLISILFSFSLLQTGGEDVMMGFWLCISQETETRHFFVQLETVSVI